MTAPIRNVVEWETIANPDPVKRHGRWPEAYIALLDCGHKVPFGGGARPTLTYVRCAKCMPVEPEAA